VLGIPNNLDQYLASERICARGAGLMLRSGSLTEAGVHAAVERLLQQPTFQEQAKRLQADFTRHDAAECFRRFVADVV
jgi:UDP:flavonoid glycosyltransferase YjiC (YdhE family)